MFLFMSARWIEYIQAKNDDDDVDQVVQYLGLTLDRYLINNFTKQIILPLPQLPYLGTCL
jgi:hypothetical protein